MGNDRTAPRPTVEPRRRRWRALRALGLIVAVIIGGSCVVTPFDVRDTIRSLDTFEPRSPLHREVARPQLVVLQHGMLRSALSLWRLEEALEQHGYAVLNTSYASTKDGIEGHSERLAEALEEHLAGRPDTDPMPELHFVGHSLGGLVIRHYLSRPDARAATSCVFLGTPHRGSQMASSYRESWMFRTFGGRSAQQLLPGDPIYQQLQRLTAPRIGCLYGTAPPEGFGTTIPGDDDGRVGVQEAQLPEQTDSVGLPLRHTFLGHDDAAIEQILHFLKHGRFHERLI